MRRLATGRLVRTFRLLVIPLFTDEHTMVEHDFALRAGGDERIVRHDDDCSALLVQLTEQVEHDLLIPLIEIAGRLVGENQLRVVDERAGDAHALLLTAGQLAGQVMRTLLQPHSFQRFHRLLLIDYRMVVLRHHHVLHRRQMRHEVKLLEHESDHVLAHIGELAGVQILQPAAFEHDGTLRRRIHAADHVHQRGFAGTGRADNRQPLPLRNGQTQVVDGVQIAVNLGNVVEFQQHMFVVHDYSSLKTMAGSIRVARRTGGMEAMTAIATLSSSDPAPSSQSKPIARPKTVVHSTRAST